MKAIELIIGRLIVGCVFTLGVCTNAHAQLQFTHTLATDERAVQLHWQSESNVAYRIEFLPDLQSSNNVWDVLYDDCPSHGTNTFWLDTGDYSRTPEILHPMGTTNRFYRLVKISTNSLPAPTVTILSPASSSTVSNEITVTVSVASTNSLYSLRLFLDGEDLGPSEDDSGTNWVINTTEWPNGQHVLFAAARIVDRYPGVPGDNSPKYAWGVSGYVPVTFNNYISRISFTEPFFEPDLGQTQRVSAVFGSFADWTLEIVDDNDSVVRTETGSGTSMTFDWDGTGDGGTPIPNGVYYYIVSAEPGQQLNAMSGGESSANEKTAENVIDAGDGYEWVEIPLPPLPPPLDTFDSPKSIWIKRLKVEKQNVAKESPYLHGYQPMEGMESGGASASASSAPNAPKRPPTNPVKGALGTFGVVAFEYATPTTNAVPTHPFGSVQIEGSTLPVVFARIPDADKLAGRFGKVVKKAGYKQAFNKNGKDVRTIELRRSDLGIGGGNLFNQVNLGMILAHGSYGTSLDFSASSGGGSLQTYLGVDGTNNAADPWIRLSDFWFDGNLRWMAIMACNTLRDANYNSMLNKNALPISDNFHLLCGASTVMYFSEYLGENWAIALKKKEPVGTAWFIAGRETYKRAKPGVITDPVVFRLSGWTSCFADRIVAWNDPDPGIDTIDERTSQVYP